MRAHWPEIAAIIIGSAGALTYLFLMVIIVGHRRRREFERVLFFLSLAAFACFSGALVLLDASIHEFEASRYILRFAVFLIAPSLCVLPSLITHAHVAYASALPDFRARSIDSQAWRMLLIYSPVPVLAFSYWFLSPVSFVTTPAVFISVFLSTAVFVVALLRGAWQDLQFAKSKSQRAGYQANIVVEAGFYRFLAAAQLAIVLVWIMILVLASNSSNWVEDILVCIFLALAVVPGGALVYAIIRYDFFEISAQRNLVYAVSAAFVALIYLTVVRRVSVWLEPVFPPEATAAILLFTSVAFFEPLQRLANKLLLRRTQEQMRKVQTVSAELQREARNGNTEKFVDFADARIRDEFGLEQARVVLSATDGGPAIDPVVLGEPILRRPAWAGQPVRLPLGKSGAEIGYLEATPAGSLISGETRAALEFLAEQLPASIELCRTIEQKVALERELALRERLALVGQMTASISHTLKNPIGSMKTVIQVQLENPALAQGVRDDLTMVLAELDRLNTKVSELLSHARPTVHATGVEPSTPLVETTVRVVELLSREASRRNCRLVLSDDSQEVAVAASEDALADILSNLIVNAIEAALDGGEVRVRLVQDGDDARIEVTDNGPGISEANRAHLFEPFFTTKASGTGLGLATVARRAGELRGAVTCDSPIAEGRGTRFTVRLPLARKPATHE